MPNRPFPSEREIKESEYAERIARIHGLGDSMPVNQESVDGVRSEEFRALTESFLGPDFDQRKLEQVEGLQIAMLSQQNQFLHRLRKGELSPELYVDEVNTLTRDTFRQIERILGNEAFVQLFGTRVDEVGALNDKDTFLKEHKEIHSGAEVKETPTEPELVRKITAPAGRAFIMHVGSTNAIDIEYTIKRQRSVREVLAALPKDAPEREFFESDGPFLRAFPDGRFHCWGVPPKALRAHRHTEIGDIVLFAPHIGIHDGGITHIGVVRAICRFEASHASRILWPATPEKRLFPWLFFFEAESGFRSWYKFLDDMGYGHRWNPRGWYRHIDEEHFRGYGGVRGYLDFIRREGHFQPTGRNA